MSQIQLLSYHTRPTSTKPHCWTSRWHKYDDTDKRRNVPCTVCSTAWPLVSAYSQMCTCSQCSIYTHHVIQSNVQCVIQSNVHHVIQSNVHVFSMFYTHITSYSQMYNVSYSQMYNVSYSQMCTCSQCSTHTSRHTVKCTMCYTCLLYTSDAADE